MGAVTPPHGYSLEQDALAIGTTLDDKYRILNVLGMGGMGIVYLAENVAIGRPVAIKILRSRARRDAATLTRFRQEARACAAIGHPGIVDVLDMGETASGQGYMVMERLEGESLATRLKQRGRLAIPEALTVITDALDAIAAAHAKGIVHRDLKPDNVFLVWVPKFRVKILDFGISRIASEEDELRLTGSNMVMGSVLYMPPEQARDARAAGPQADLYALGAVLYHALAGRPPFVGQNYSEVLSKVLTDPHEPLAQHAPHVPADIAMLIDELLAKNPTKRPASAKAVRAALIAMAPEPLRPPVQGANIGTAKTLAPGEHVVKPAMPLGETVDATQAPELGATVADTAAAPTARPPGALLESAPTMGELASRTQPPSPRSRAWIAGAALAAVVAGGALVMVARSGSGGSETPADATAPAATADAAPAPADARPPPADAPADAAESSDNIVLVDAAVKAVVPRDAGVTVSRKPDAGAAPPDAAPKVDSGLLEVVPTP